MKSLGIVLITSIFSALGASFLIWFLGSTEHENWEKRLGDAQSEMTRARDQIGLMQTKISALEQKFDELEFFNALNTTRPSAPAKPQAIERTPVEPPQRSVAANSPSAEEVASEYVPVDENLRKQVLQIMEQKQQEELAQEQQRSEDRRVERLKSRVARLQEQLHLDSYQNDEVYNILNTYETNLRDLRLQMRNSGIDFDRQGMLEAFRNESVTRDNKLSATLTPAQWEQYKESEASPWQGMQNRLQRLENALQNQDGNQ